MRGRFGLGEGECDGLVEDYQAENPEMRGKPVDIQIESQTIGTHVQV